MKEKEDCIRPFSFVHLGSVKHPTVLLPGEERAEDTAQQVVTSRRSGMSRAEVRHRRRSRHLFHPSRKQQLKAGELPFNLSAPNTFVKINIAI